MSAIIIPMHQAKSSLSQLVKRAAGGETIFIGSYGRGGGGRTAPPSGRPPHPQGRVAGRRGFPDDFDAPLPPELLAAFGGEEA